MKAESAGEYTVNEMTRKDNTLRVIQIHPSLRCNLTCKHCYSSSGPTLKSYVQLNDIYYFLEYARSYGFDVLSVSGGEPFLYPRLEELLIASHTLGNKNVAVSNGTLFQSDKAKRALKHLDLVAVSIDGRESFHDEIRHLRGAFDKMIKGVEILRDLGISFGFIHTTTEESWRDLLWLAEFAASKGAALLQLHPLELTGRALAEFSHLVPSQESLQKVFILGSYIDEKYTGKMKVQLDFLHRNIILQSPGTISFFGTNFELNKTNFSDAVKCLVIDQKGDVYPMSYGFAEYFRMGHISEVTEGRDIIADFINNKGRDMYRLIQKIFRMIEIEETDDLIVWTELIVKNSHSYRDAPSDSYNHPLATQRPC